MLTTFLTFNALALVDVLAMARYSSVLVDEKGRALGQTDAWSQQTVPAGEVVSVVAAANERVC